MISFKQLDKLERVEYEKHYITDLEKNELCGTKQSMIIAETAKNFNIIMRK